MFAAEAVQGRQKKEEIAQPLPAAAYDTVIRPTWPMSKKHHHYNFKISSQWQCLFAALAVLTAFCFGLHFTPFRIQTAVIKDAQLFRLKDAAAAAVN